MTMLDGEVEREFQKPSPTEEIKMDWPETESTLEKVLGSDLFNKYHDRFKTIFAIHGWEAFTQLLSEEFLISFSEQDNEKITQTLNAWFSNYENQK